MAVLLDTSIAIHLRDETAAIGDHFAALADEPFLSAVSLVELQGGVYAKPELTNLRRAKLDLLLDNFSILDFVRPMSDEYGRIVAQLGFNRRLIADRMIAATAIFHGLTLVTCNGRDFADIDGLNLEIWNA